MSMQQQQIVTNSLSTRMTTTEEIITPSRIEDTLFLARDIDIIKKENSDTLIENLIYLYNSKLRSLLILNGCKFSSFQLLEKYLLLGTVKNI